MRLHVHKLILISLSLLCGALCRAADCPAEMRGGWVSELPIASLFEISLTVAEVHGGNYEATLETADGTEAVAVWQEGRPIRLQSARLPISFEGEVTKDGAGIDGFVAFASNLYRVSLGAAGKGTWSLLWSPLAVESDTVTLDLYFDAGDAGETAGYFFFRDQRLPGLFGFGTRCEGRTVRLGEKNLALDFTGEFTAGFSRLAATVTAPGGEADMVFLPMSAARAAMPPGQPDYGPRPEGAPAYAGDAPPETADGWLTGTPAAAGADADVLARLVAAVTSGKLPSTHGILVARHGRLVFEEYFHGFDLDALHDMRSASKSIASTLTGLAVDDGLIDSSESLVLPFFPHYRWLKNWSSGKARIRVRDLLTMSSGLDANDSDGQSVAAEWAYQSQSAQPDWIRFALDAPMLAEPGARHIYGSANPLILGGVLASAMHGGVEWFAERRLFAPLGIERYRIYLDPTGLPYMGGGMHLRPRDMLKIGQLYLDDGRWAGRQVLSAAWVAESFGKYGRLEPLQRNGNEYGYLWWHENYVIDGKTVASIEARGNGGQYIFVVPALDLTAVITSGNYRGGIEMTRQPQTIFAKYVLPAFLD